MAEAVRAQLDRELRALPTSAPDVERLLRDAASPTSSTAPTRLLAAAACLVLLATTVLAVRVADRDTVVLGDGPSSAPAAGASGDLRPATADDLRGRTFRSVGELPGAPVPEAVLTLGFGSGQRGAPDFVASSDPGCNAIRSFLDGGWTIDGDGRLVLGTVERTLMDCEDRLIAQEDWLFDVLLARPRVLVHASVLVLERPEGDLAFVDSARPSAAAIAADPCLAAALRVADLLAAVLDSVDPDTGEPDGSVEGDLSTTIDAAVADTGCAEEEVRRRATEQLYLTVLAVRDQAWIDERTTLLNAIVIALNPGDFGLGTPLPVPTVAPRPPGPTPTPTPLPTSGPGIPWCGDRGLVGAVVSTAGALEALCGDGSRIEIDAGPGWTTVDLGTLRMVAEHVDPETGERTFSEYALQSPGLRSRTPGGAPALAPDDRLAWVDEGGDIRADGIDRGIGVADGTIAEVRWDRAGRWLLHRIEGGEQVYASDAAAASDRIGAISVPGLISMTGEVDTPGNVVLLVDRGGSVALDAAFVDGSGPADPFGLASTAIPSALFGEAAFVEAAGLLRPDPASGAWSSGSSIGWVLGDGSTAWYVDGIAAPIVLGTDIRSLSIRPPDR